MTDTEAFWPEGARLAVTVSMQFEAGVSRSAAPENPSPNRFWTDPRIWDRTRSMNTAHAKVCHGSWI